MPIAPGNYPIIEPNTPLGRALVEFFDVLVPVYGSGEKGGASRLLYSVAVRFISTHKLEAVPILTLR
ncbi:hypothetical protein HMEPL2_11740 [Vreelandella aquamarina]|uniref:Uncharacterized protein n=1 Tax=Vreelandella aquamarina TaxID=77097 RepID=A0A6F8XBS6_9GAMM|nr:hypothetical protein HMEPL2_11740 [Halomonas meridiana]